MMTKEQADIIDLLINTLREHEKELDRLIGEMQLLPTKREQIVSSLVYAINSELSLDKTTTRLFVSEFFHSLNRRGVIDNDETSALIQEAYEKLDVK